MELEDAYKCIINGNAILITGSGAHKGVKNPDGEPFPSGVELSRRLFKASGIINPDDPNDLQDATDTFLERNGNSEEKLINELRSLLSVGSLTNAQRDLYTQPWQRVYTTNYDEVPMLATRGTDYELMPVTLSSSFKRDWDDTRYCVYINGFVGNLNENTLQSEFRLSGKSYMASEVLQNSPWGAIFSEDVETSDCIVVVGLSFDYDLDLKRFLYNPKVIDKTIFIEKKDISETQERKLRRLGSVFNISVEGFVDALNSYKAKHPVSMLPQEAYIYRSFELCKRRDSYQKATSLDVNNLFMYGECSNPLFYLENGRYIDLVYRDKLDLIKNALETSCRVIYLHANLGNGKTVFLECLKHQLGKSDYFIFELKGYYEGITAKEVQQIASLPGKKLIIIENYFNYIKVLEKFSLYHLDNIQFILTARTVLYETRILEANDCLRIKEGESLVVDLNKLNSNEINSLNTILERNGLWGKFRSLPIQERKYYLKLKRYGNSEFQGILVEVLNSTAMKNKVEELISNIKNESDVYFDILILALLIKVMTLDLNPDDISKILNINIALDAKFIHDENVREILDFSGGETKFKLKSAVTAKLILNGLNCNDTIIKVLRLTAIFANKYNAVAKYENVLRNISSYSHVNTFLNRSDQAGAFLINYYDSLKELEYYKENSFFWLNYAMACSNMGEFILAQTYLDNAYSFFRRTERTVPFQIDTQQAKLYLLIIEKEAEASSTELFSKAHELLMKPAISQKDNEEKRIELFDYYLKKSVLCKLPKSFDETYKKYCGEAFNKVNNFINSNSFHSKEPCYEDLRQKLLKACINGLDIK